jgi:hypothetical protein
MSPLDIGPAQQPDRPIWFERVFHFDLPPWLMPNVIERLRGTPARVEDRVARVGTPVLVRRDGDHWSIQENIGHLLDLEALWLGRIDDFEAGEERLRAADLTNRATHQAGHNDRPIGQILEAFRTARAVLVHRLETLAPAVRLRTAFHPRLDQVMRPIDHAFFVAEHDDHHLARIAELLSR